MLQYKAEVDTVVTVRGVQGYTGMTGAGVYASINKDEALVRFGIKGGDPSSQTVFAGDCRDLAEFFTRLAEQLDSSS